jgi:acyl dehydratase
MPRSLADLPRGHQFPVTDFQLTPEWVEDYREAVEDRTTAALGADVVPGMAVAALAIRSLLQASVLPPGSIHLGQELSLNGPVGAGERLRARAEVASRGERQGWALMSIDMGVQDSRGREVMSGKATLTFPVDGEEVA